MHKIKIDLWENWLRILNFKFLKKVNGGMYSEFKEII